MDELSPADRQTAIRESLELCQSAPWEQLSAAIEAVKSGGTFRLGAKASGISYWVLKTMYELGQAGHPVWEQFAQAIDRADAISQMPTMTKLKGQSEEGIASARKEYMQLKNPEEWGSYIPESRPSGSGNQMPNGITVQIAQFGEGHAAQERQQQGGAILEHKEAGEGGLPAQASGGDSHVESGEVNKATG